MIGTSLNEPHANMTALCTCVCMLIACLLTCLLGPTTYYKFQMSIFKYFTKIDISCMKHVKASGGLTVRVQRRQPGVKTTEVEACMATCDLCFYQWWQTRQCMLCRHKPLLLSTWCSIFCTIQWFWPDYWLLLELHALTLAARSYVLLRYI